MSPIKEFHHEEHEGKRRMLSIFVLFVLSVVSLFLLQPSPAVALDFGKLGEAIGLDPETTKQLERGARVASALVPISDSEERQLGRSVAAKVIGRFGLERDEARQHYLSLVGMTVATRSGRPDLTYRFAILATDDVNAYACPGGYIFVTRGALAMVQDEAELAAVLAHEVAHASERHIVKAMQKSQLMQVGGEVAAEAFKAGGPLFDKMTEFATDALFNGLSRDDELAADGKGLETLDRTGYDGPAYFDLLKLLEGRRKAGQTAVLGRTHPSPSDRMQNLQQQLPTLGLAAPTGVRLPDRFAQNLR